MELSDLVYLNIRGRDTYIRTWKGLDKVRKTKLRRIILGQDNCMTEQRRDKIKDIRRKTGVLWKVEPIQFYLPYYWKDRERKTKKIRTSKEGQRKKRKDKEGQDKVSTGQRKDWKKEALDRGRTYKRRPRQRKDIQRKNQTKEGLYNGSKYKGRTRQRKYWPKKRLDKVSTGQRKDIQRNTQTKEGHTKEYLDKGRTYKGRTRQRKHFTTEVNTKGGQNKEWTHKRNIEKRKEGWGFLIKLSVHILAIATICI